jgi:Zn-dependent protease with chaperone function
VDRRLYGVARRLTAGQFEALAQGPLVRRSMSAARLGHFVNGDVRRGLLTQVAETALGDVAGLFAPPPSGSGGIIEMISRSVGWAISRTAMLFQLVLVWISLRDSQRAEYLADELAARAGGTDAAIRLADHLLLITALDTVIRRGARAGNGIPAWQAAAVTARANQAPDVPLLRRLSGHTEASLYSSHPPAGLRAEMLEGRPRHPAAVRLGEAASARIDEELDAYAKRVRRELAESA